MPEVEVGVKRSMDYDEYNEANKMAKSDTIEVRLLLLGRNCGGIIGKGGENISRLRSTYNATVRMPSTQTPDRAMTITGSVENCVGVVQEVLTHCDQVPHSTNQQCSIELNLLVPTNQIGSIVGKGGSKITEIRNATNAKIKVYEECLPGSNERVIAIGGESIEQLLTTLSTIVSMLQEVPNKSRPSYYMPENMGMGGGKMTMPSPRKMKSETWGNDSKPSMSGFNPKGAAPLMGASSGTGPQPLMGNSNPSIELAWLQLQTTTTITAPNELCGAIIGKGGSRISQIRNGSGAQISFSESTKDSTDDRVITITGTQQQVQMAEQMITRYTSTM